MRETDYIRDSRLNGTTTVQENWGQNGARDGGEREGERETQTDRQTDRQVWIVCAC